MKGPVGRASVPAMLMCNDLSRDAFHFPALHLLGTLNLELFVAMGASCKIY
jgi:hypothetical protein